MPTQPVTFRSIVATELGVEYWEQTAQGVLPLRECLSCGTKRQYLTTVCARCSSTDWTWVASSGLGTIYASTLVRYRLSPEFPESYILALVDLDDDVRVMTNILGADFADAGIGARVRLVFETLTDGKRLPQFELAID